MARLDVAIDASKAVAGARNFNGAIASMKVATTAASATMAGGTAATVAFSAALLAIPAAALAVEAVLIKALVKGGIKASLAMMEVAGAAEEIEAKFRAVFKGEAVAAALALDQFGDAAGRSTVKLKEMAGTVQDTLVPLGMQREVAADLAIELTKLATDVASFNNALEQNVIDNFQSAMVGASRAVLGYGIVIRQDLVEQEALNMGLAKTVSALGEQDKVMARAAIMFRSTADAQGDAVRTADSYQNTLKRVKGEVYDLQAAVGVQLTEAFRTAANEGVGVEDMLIAIEMALGITAEAAKETIGWLGELAAWSINFARMSDEIDQFFEERKMAAFGRRLMAVREELGYTEEEASALALNALGAASAIRVLSGGTATLADSLRMARMAAENTFETDRTEAFKKSLGEMGVPAQEIADAFKDAKVHALTFGAAIDEPAEKLRMMREYVASMFEDVLTAAQQAKMQARIDELVESYKKGRKDMAQAPPEERALAAAEAQTDARAALAKAIDQQRGALESLAPTAERNVAIDQMVEQQLSRELLLIAARAEARRHDLSTTAKTLQLSAREAEMIAQVNVKIHEQEKALWEVTRALEEKARAEREAAVFAQEHGLMLGAMDDALGGIGSAAGAAAVGFGEFGEMASNALRQMAANMISAAVQAAMFMAIIKPLLGAMGLSGGQIGALFPQFGNLIESAKGNLFSGGARVERFGAGGFPFGMISGPTGFGMPSGLGVAGERGSEVGWGSKSAITPLRKDPVSGEWGVRAVGAGGGRFDGASFTFNTTINAGGGGDSVGRGFRRSLRHYERELRAMPARIGG